MSFLAAYSFFALETNIAMSGEEKFQEGSEKAESAVKQMKLNL
jgi:hypothetical protein